MKLCKKFWVCFMIASMLLLPASFSALASEVNTNIDEVVPSSTKYEVLNVENHKSAAKTSAIYEYEQVSGDEVIITRYTGNESSVSIPATLDGYNVVGIGEYAFEDCLSVQEVFIPKEITSLYNAFYGCKNLIKVEFEEGILQIPESALEGVTVKTVIIPKGVTEIGRYAFASTKLSTIDLPSTVTTIGEYAFEDSSIEELILPEGVEVIEEAAFKNCTKLSKIEFSSTVDTIEVYSFEGCTSLQEVFIPKGLETFGESWGEGPFTGCTNLTKVEFEAGRLQIPAYAFNGVPVKTVIIPEGVTEIGDSAFEATKIATLALPTSLTTIGEYSFANTPIVELILPEGVETIDYGAFKDCTKLANIQFSSTVVEIDAYSFGGCTSLQEVFIPKGITKFGEMWSEGPFTGCSNLSKVEFEKGTLLIPAYAFTGVPVKTVIIPDTVTAIGKQAFESTKISAIDLPTSVQTIGEWAFENTPIVELILPEGVDTIKEGAFKDCTKLEKVQFSSTVSTIEEYSFENCTSLIEVFIPKGLKTFGVSWDQGPFTGCSNLSKVEFEEGTLQIPTSAFYDVPVKTVIIPKGVTQIGYKAFGWTNVEEIELPRTVTEIDDDAFMNCSSLKKIKIPRSVTWIGGSAFNESENVVIYTPTDSYAQEYAIENDIKYINEDIHATSVVINKESATMQKKTSMELSVVIEPEDCTDLTVWSSSNETIATVTQDGVVTAKDKAGKAVITAKVGDISVTCTIEVLPTPVSKIVLNKTTLELIRNKFETLTVTVSPTDADNKDVVWSSSNTKVATVDSTGKVTAVGVGTATITATADDGSGVKATCTVTVKPILATKVVLNKTTLELEKGKAGTLTATVSPTDADNKDVVWSSSNTKIVTVDSNGNVTAVGVGTASIIATAKDGSGVKATCTVTVKVVNNGWKNESGKWYYYRNGQKVTGWLYDAKTWYYMKSNGVMATGWVYDGGVWYYMKSSGAMATGWVNDGGTWYYMKSSGAMATGWVYDGGTWYYLDKNGVWVS